MYIEAANPDAFVSQQ